MKERATIKLTEKDIQKLLFEHFNISEQEAELKITLGNNAQGISSTIKIKEKINLDSLIIESEKILEMDDIINILNIKLNEYDYEVSNFEYIPIERSMFSLNYIKFKLNKKEKEKIKKKGLKRNV